MRSLEIRVPLLSPKSQVRVTSEALRYWLGSWMLMLKAIARFWMKFWSSWLTSLIWLSDMVNGIWSNGRATGVEMLSSEFNPDLIDLHLIDSNSVHINFTVFLSSATKTTKVWCGHLWWWILWRHSQEEWTCPCHGSGRWLAPCCKSPGEHCLYRCWVRMRVHLPPASNALRQRSSVLIFRVEWWSLENY